DCGDGSGYGAFSSTANATCPTNDNGVRSVTGKVKDKDGGASEYTATVNVNSVPPTATLSNDGPVNEGSRATIYFTSQSDPSMADTAAGFRYEYHCDGSVFGPASYAAASTSATSQCTFNNEGTYTVRARIIDKDNDSSTYTTNVVVKNVPPTVTLSGPSSALP